MKIDDKYKWLARDEDGELWAFVAKPYKSIEVDERCGIWNGCHEDYFEVEEKDDTYSFVKWNDEEPFAINGKPIVGFNEQNNPQIDVVTKPSHYIGINGLEVEQILEEFLPKIEDSYVAHRIGSAVEYILRAYSKNNLQDIKKAKRNLEQVIAYEESKVKPEETPEVKPIEFDGNGNDHLTDFLECLRGIKVMEDKNMEKVSTFYHGYNLND